MKKSKGFTLIEVLVASLILTTIFGFLTYGIVYIKDSFKLIAMSERYSRLHYVQNFLENELYLAKDLVYPSDTKNPNQEHYKILYVNKLGELNMVFLTEDGVLSHYNLQKKSFRDIQSSVDSFHCKRKSNGNLELYVSLAINQEKLVIQYETSITNKEIY
ncbi:MAG: type II secretion system protein [Candidatus Cloacimonetes bacterium]|nr:type II secretion system protein [Candidatus Cloacimonadota bacterium]